MKKRAIKILSAVLAPPLLLFFTFLIYLHTPITPTLPEIHLEKGMPLRDIANKLEEQQIIRFPFLFRLYAQTTGNGGRLKAGVYLFDKPSTPKEVLNKLVKGLVEVVKVKIIEGWTAKEIAQYLHSLPSNTNPQFQQIFLEKIKDPLFIKTLGLQVETLEGYLYPDTYFLERGATPGDAISQFVTEFWKNDQKALEGLPALPTYSQHQIVTLASLIEKESGVDAERPIIASVFYNRLAKGMALQSDPTIIYGLKNFSGDIKRADIRNPHPYNTYMHAGLPPGPICNPGFASIKAALNPAKTNYLYFVSKGDGTHYFSRTAEEHSEAVRKFQMKKEE